MQTDSNATIYKLGALFAACGTTRHEAAHSALPAHRVPHRLTTAEQLADAEQRNLRDRRPAQAAIIHSKITQEGDERHPKFGVYFKLADGTEQYFPPHKI